MTKGTLVEQVSTLTGLTLFLTGVAALAYIGWSAMQSTRVEAQRHCHDAATERSQQYQSD